MHRFVPDRPSAADASLSAAEEVAALKRWTRRFLHLAPEAVVSVHTTPCADLGCPVAETTVVVQMPGASTRGWRFQRTRIALSRVVVEQVLATPGFIVFPRETLPPKEKVDGAGATAPPPRSETRDR